MTNAWKPLQENIMQKKTLKRECSQTFHLFIKLQATETSRLIICCSFKDEGLPNTITGEDKEEPVMSLPQPKDCREKLYNVFFKK